MLQILLYISDIVPPVHKLKEDFVIWYVMDKNPFHFFKIPVQTYFVVNLSLCATTDLKTCITKNESFISIISYDPETSYRSVRYHWKYFSKLLLMDTFVTCFVLNIMCKNSNQTKPSKNSCWSLMIGCEDWN